MSVEYVMIDGSPKRKVVTVSYEDTDINQVQSLVTSAQEAVNEKQRLHDEAVQALEDAEVELDKAKVALEDSKSGLAQYQTLVGEPGDDEGGATEIPTHGSSSEVEDLASEQLI